MVRPPTASLRDRLIALTTALERRSDDDEIRFDPGSGEVTVRSRLDDVEEALVPSARSGVVPAPGGLWEWAVRRDFVRSLPRGRARRRLGDCLGGPQTRRRFAVVLATLSEDDLSRRSFARFRRRRLRHWAARVLRAPP